MFHISPRAQGVQSRHFSAILTRFPDRQPYKKTRLRWTPAARSKAGLWLSDMYYGRRGPFQVHKILHLHSCERTEAAGAGHAPPSHTGR